MSFGAIMDAYVAHQIATTRRARLDAMSPDERDAFYREEEAALDRRRTEAAERAAAALERRARRLFL